MLHFWFSILVEALGLVGLPGVRPIQQTAIVSFTAREDHPAAR